MPAEQTSPEPQKWPHVPQFARSSHLLVHPLPQKSGAATGQTHSLPLQISSTGHVNPQPPQLDPSSWMLTHVPLHRVVPPLHEREQTPVLQTCPAPQALPQVPQLERSLDLLVHVLPQRSGATAGQVHAPLAQL